MLANGSCPEGKQCAVGSCEDGVCHGGSACASPVVLYTTSLYYAICSVSGVGTMIAKPHNTVEQVSAGLIHLMTGMMWAYLIGVFTSLASNFSPTVAQFREDLSKLNSFMSSNNLPSETRFRLREYLHETVHLRDTDMQAALLQKLPPAMQDEVAWLVNEGWLQRVWYLRQIAKSSNRLLMRLASGLKPLIFMPGEMCPLGFLYFIKRGQVLYGGKVVSEGSAWGEDVLLDHPTLQLDFSAISTVYTWVLFMDGRVRAHVHMHMHTCTSTRGSSSWMDDCVPVQYLLQCPL